LIRIGGPEPHRIEAGADLQQFSPEGPSLFCAAGFATKRGEISARHVRIGIVDQPASKVGFGFLVATEGKLCSTHHIEKQVVARVEQKSRIEFCECLLVLSTEIERLTKRPMP
jgi:hypothetical protein